VEFNYYLGTLIENYETPIYCTSAPAHQRQESTQSDTSALLLSSRRLINRTMDGGGVHERHLPYARLIINFLADSGELKMERESNKNANFELNKQKIFYLFSVTR
jgi:hypothetical protein